MEGLNGGIVSNVFAIISLVCWIFVYTPQCGAALKGKLFFSQLYKNYKLKSNAAEALSMGFLVSWLIGDCFFIISGICKVFWLSQMPLALLLVGVWYTLADLILILQTVYYRKNYTVTVLQEKKLLATEFNLQSEAQFEQHLGDPTTPTESALALNSINFVALLPLLFGFMQMLLAAPAAVLQQQQQTKGQQSVGAHFYDSDPNAFLGRTSSVETASASSHVHELEKLKMIADICSWLAFVFFTGARLPQLYKNWTNKTASGLSMLMFAFCLTGNGTSFLAYAFHSAGMHANIPLICGAGGSFLLDAGICMQTLYFRRQSHKLHKLESLQIGAQEKVVSAHS